MVFAQTSQTIYKFVDESGRVTYANSPIKGGAKLNLEPLTVIQSSPATTSTNVPTARAIPVAKVTSVPSPAYSITAAPVMVAAVVTAPAVPAAAPAVEPIQPTTIAALETADKVQERAQQRRADIRRRIVEGEIQAEEKLLVATRAALAEEQARSVAIRALRASFAATAAAVTAQKPLISPETRAEIERHFERVRNLQDELAMHEGSITALREEMVAMK
jgi:hypothetical protein